MARFLFGLNWEIANWWNCNIMWSWKIWCTWLSKLRTNLRGEAAIHDKTLARDHHRDQIL